MARASGKPGFKGMAFHPLAVILTLLAAEAIGMLAVAPLMKWDKGYVALAGLGVLPLWATLLTLVYTADRRYRALLILAILTAVCVALLLL